MKKILLIEGDAPLSWLLGKILRTRYEVTVLQNGMEAWSWLSERNTPDLIIADVNLPSLDGIELLENIRISGLLSNIPFMILSGVPDDAQRDQCLELGAFSYISKPFEPQAFLSEVQRGLVYKNEGVFIS
jgi:two-component system chemotaxis response regulator CheY